jgi:N-methylhydantoinase A/oxoprolinase/acetone carboxylase beta subunit
MKRPADVRIGVDTGGTFTDFVIVRGGVLSAKKLPSTPGNPSRAILEGVSEFLEDPGRLQIIHGTTVATNALLERKGARIALIASRGFEDVIFIGRQTRRLLYSLNGEPRRSIVDRRDVFGLEERTTAAGRIARAVRPGEADRVAAEIARRGIEAVAVCLINSYANPANERTIGRALQRAGLLASLSSDILPEYREYERTSTAAVNAYLMPILNAYLGDLEKNVGRADLQIMQSNEGYITAAKAKGEPIRTALSGPAGGAVASLALAKAAGFPRIVSFDMGGTSTDVSLIEGRIRRTSENVIGDFPVRIPMIDILSVGAGGGSIAHVDAGGSLRVGPQSAGADPGPACYGRGELPTVTDANVVLGRIDPCFFLGGTMRIDPQRSLRAVRILGRRIGKTVLAAAQGIIDIANANMEKAVRVISIERGYDPRDFALFSFGGAGGLHAADMADHLHIKGVVVPARAGVLSALGLLLADAVKDYSRAVLRTTDRIRPDEYERWFRELERRGARGLAEEGFPPGRIVLERSADVRYLGQSYEISVPFPGRGRGLAENFHRLHERLYSYRHPQAPVEIVAVRVKARGLSDKIRLPKGKSAKVRPSAAAALIKKQVVHYGGRRFAAGVYDRDKLAPGARLKEPALVIDFGSTTFLPPGHALRVDDHLNLVLAKGRGA